MYYFFCGTKSSHHRSQREFTGWKQLLCRSVLSCTPIPGSIKLKIHSTHADSHDSETSSYFVPFLCDHALLHRSRNSGREFAGWKQLPSRQVLSLHSHLLFNGSIWCMNITLTDYYCVKYSSLL